MSTPSNAPDRNTAVHNLRALLSENGNSGWDRAWKESVTPWDQGEIQPPLAEALTWLEQRLPMKGRALVPGCGRGYDAVFIASVLDYYVLGIDLSPSAVDAANAYAQKVVTLNDSARDRVMFRATDFFNFAIEEEERFDVVFDHTFFCAIPPSLRSAWGQEMAALLTPGGFLITLVFPIDGSREGGPPYSVSVDIYAQALGSHWTKTLDKIPSESSPSHEGRERLVIWRKNLYL